MTSIQIHTATIVCNSEKEVAFSIVLMTLNPVTGCTVLLVAVRIETITALASNIALCRKILHCSVMK